MKRPSNRPFPSETFPVPRPPSHAPFAFTLVEMLVVITIIGILAGLVTAAAIRARIAAKNAAVAIDISQLDAALKAYKEKFGEYPPDNETNPLVVQRHLAKAFPRYSNLSGWRADATAAGMPTLTPQTALVFWLGGRYDATTGQFTGFSANPIDPFDNNPSGIGPFFEFDPTRLSSHKYWPQEAVGDTTTGAGALVYFRAENSNYTGKSVLDPGGATVHPATRNTSAVWMTPRSFQIFSAGLDAQYSDLGGGGPLQFPDGGNYDPDGHTFDDITNFSAGTLEDAMP